MRTSDSTLHYNCKDAAYTLECCDEFMSDIDKIAAPDQNSFRSTYDHTIELYQPLMYMMSRGIKVNQARLKVESQRIGTRIEEVTEEIRELCSLPDLNPGSTQQIQAYFYGTLGIPPYTKRNTKGGSSITTDDKALQRIARGTSARKGRPEASLIQEYRKLTKLKGTYLDMRFDSDSRMRCSYNPRGTKFGRVSSGTTIFDTGMNMQNLPPSFTGFMIADDDCIFIDLDKAKAEWVVVAYVSGDESMISAIEQGVDVHAWTGSKMFNFPLDVVLQEDEIIAHESDPIEVAKLRKNIPLFEKAIEQRLWLPRQMSIRQCGKKSNHGLNYDEGPDEFGLINEITAKEAKVIVDFYHTTYPGVERYHEHTRNTLQSHGRVLQNLYGRPCRFLGQWNSKLWKSAYSFIPQSTVGELINRSLVEIYHSSADALENLEIMRQVHDNVTFQIRLDDPRLGTAIRLCRETMDPELEAGGRSFKIGTDMKVGFNLGEMVKVDLVDNDEKQAELIRSAAGGLENSWGLVNDVPRLHTEHGATI